MSFMIASSLCYYFGRSSGPLLTQYLLTGHLLGARPREWGGLRQRCLEFYILRGMKAQGTRGTAERP